jgi:hypothetical protein
MTPIYYGAYVPGGVDDWSKVDGFEANAGKQLSILMFGYAWKSPVNGYQAFPAQVLNKIRNRGTIPLVDWGSQRLGGDVNQPDFQLSKIASGAHDAFLIQWAQSAKRWGQPFFLRFDAEMNGWWLPWSEQVNGNAPGDYVRAWRHVVDVFRQQGATNVTWVWCPNIQGPKSTPLASLFPGNDYVDWTCADGYNWGTDYGNSWTPFADVFKASRSNGGNDTYALLQQLAPSKPMMIGETASSENGGSKSAWIADMLGTQLPTAFPNVKAVLWFNWNDDDPIKSWPIESSPAAQQAFRTGIASSYYASNQFGTITTSPIPPIGATAAPTPPAVTAPSYKDVVLADTPIGYWRLGEASGTTAVDQVGANPGTYSGGPTLGVAGAPGHGSSTAVTLDGSSQYVTVPDAGALSPEAGATGELSLEAWVKLSALPTGGPATVMAKGTTKGFEYGLRVRPDGSVEIRLWTAGGSTYQAVASPAGAVTPGAWVHLVGTCDNGASCQVYVNGTQRASVSSGWGATPPSDGTAALTIGRRADGVQPLVGTVGEVAVYGRALSASRVSAHYSAGH